MRLDLFLVQNHLASSRTQAQDFIASGFVYILQENKKIQLKKASFLVNEALRDKIQVEANQLQKYVSRAGLKLESALKFLKVNVTGKIILDIGQSTGGFTDCLIQSGASQVVGIDVGHNQLHSSLRSKRQIVSIEGLNAKDLETDIEFLKLLPAEKFDMIVMDVSFISITKVIGCVAKFVKTGGEYLFLVKPQFECGRGFLDKNGIVNNSAVYAQIEATIKNVSSQNFNNVEAYFKSDIIGKDGNQEYFIYGKNHT